MCVELRGNAKEGSEFICSASTVEFNGRDEDTKATKKRVSREYVEL